MGALTAVNGAEEEGYDGTLLIGPFNCLPYRIAETVLGPLSLTHGMPLLTCKSDGYSVASAFLRQLGTRVQQVSEEARRGLTRRAGNGQRGLAPSTSAFNRADPGRAQAAPSPHLSPCNSVILTTTPANT